MITSLVGHFVFHRSIFIGSIIFCTFKWGHPRIYVLLLLILIFTNKWLPKQFCWLKATICDCYVSVAPTKLSGPHLKSWPEPWHPYQSYDLYQNYRILESYFNKARKNGTIVERKQGLLKLFVTQLSNTSERGRNKSLTNYFTQICIKIGQSGKISMIGIVQENQ